MCVNVQYTIGQNGNTAFKVNVKTLETLHVCNCGDNYIHAKFIYL